MTKRIFAGLIALLAVAALACSPAEEAAPTATEAVAAAATEVMQPAATEAMEPSATEAMMDEGGTRKIG